jgi:hypothetical protein
MTITPFIESPTLEILPSMSGFVNGILSRPIHFLATQRD